MHRQGIIAALVLGASACTQTFEEGPRDLSVLGHDNVAAMHEAAARQEEARFDPKAETQRQRCAHGRRNDSDPFCWTIVTNPTMQHKQKAAAFRASAEEHRLAAASLRRDIASACDGVAESERYHSVFEHTADIVEVADLVADDGVLQGASVTLRAPQGVTRYDLERWTGCEIARNAATGFIADERDFSPLDVEGVSASVQSVSGGLRVDVLAHDPTAGAEIAKRAKALLTLR